MLQTTILLIVSVFMGGVMRSPFKTRKYTDALSSFDCLFISMDIKTVFVFLTIIATASACGLSTWKKTHQSEETWPKFSKMWNNYPRYSQYWSEELIHKCKLQDWLIRVNTCAVRVSHSLISSGKTINDIDQTGCSWYGATNTDGDNYIILVPTMRCYLEDKRGSADIISSNQTDFEGHEGIIVFQDCGFDIATGHVDLWDGNWCLGLCFFSRCNDIRLFEW
ncbi:uncharacterized protein [Ptychodera flava]|uniref:uncharacterized protein n=1 Tax=Ptychodera flava TaxID=63121 RepID=UPI00396A472B